MDSIRSEIFATDFVDQPFWWGGTPRPRLTLDDLPQKVDVLVIGSGYTGLCASIQTARAGRSTLVIDAEDIGWGCSSRNGGQVSSSVSKKTTYVIVGEDPGSKRDDAVQMEIPILSDHELRELAERESP